MDRAERTPANSFKRSSNVEVNSVVDAIYRVDLLEIEIKHIEEQIAIARDRERLGIGVLDTIWVRKAVDSSRHKNEEVAELKRWINSTAERKREILLNIVRQEFDDADWRDIEAEAEHKFRAMA